MQTLRTLSSLGQLAQQTDGAASETVEVTVDVLQILAGVALGVVAALVIGIVIFAIGRVLANRRPVLKVFTAAVYRPFQVLLILIGAWVGFSLVSAKAGLASGAPGSPYWVGVVDQAIVIVMILAVTWFVVGILNGVTAVIHERIRESSERRAKRVQTQMQILHRVIVVVVWILGFAGVLLTFPGARAAGASLIASAGVVSVVAGLAAQTTLGNVFAGLQLAFSDSIRVGDIVLYETNYTTVEEITLTYVVLAVWDGRRIIVPSSLMTTQSFENWTRRAPEMVGTLEIDVDWSVPITAARNQLKILLAQTDLWDGRTGVLQVTDAQGGYVKLRIVVSAKNSSTLTDLKNYLREAMVRWIQDEAPQAMPHNRNWEYVPEHALEARAATEAKVEERLAEAFPPSVGIAGEGEELVTTADQQRTVIFTTAELEGLRQDMIADPEEREARNRLANLVEGREGHEASLFSGSPDAEERNKTFAGPDQEVYDERNRRIEASTGTIEKTNSKDTGDGDVTRIMESAPDLERKNQTKGEHNG